MSGVMQAPACDHYFEYHMLGGEPISVGVCRFCRNPNWADLRLSLDNLTAAATERIRSYVALLESELDDDQSEDDFSRGRFSAQRQIIADLLQRLPDHKHVPAESGGGTDG